MQPSVIVLAEEDNVAVALRHIAAGSAVAINGMTLVARDAIPLGHKMAIRPIAAGGKIRKFGVPVGSATAPIEPGCHVHVHNVKSDYVTNRAAL